MFKKYFFTILIIIFGILFVYIIHETEYTKKTKVNEKNELDSKNFDNFIEKNSGMENKKIAVLPINEDETLVKKTEKDIKGAKSSIGSLAPIMAEEGKSIVLYEVPFTSQAPFGEWYDPKQQDGCEEASALMAVKWARGENLDRNIAKDEIISISDYQALYYQEYRDTSAADTKERIINKYFEYEDAEIKNNILISDIINELDSGNIIITPMNGRALGNPYFTPPGPDRHMLVIIGYDREKREFITNDPGTKRGENYHYNMEVLYNAIRDYPTGFHEEIIEVKKNMIVVYFNK